LKNLQRFKLESIVILWSVTEGFLGGVLHIFKIPFTGIIVGSFALIYITLIIYNSDTRKDLINSTIVVIICKMILSPQTPVFAYIAVFLQGFLGYALYGLRHNLKSMCILLGISIQLINGFIKIFTLTLLFGFNLWVIFNEFIKYVISQFSLTKTDVNYSLILVLIYILIHLAIGLTSGILASKFIHNLKFYVKKDKYKIIIRNVRQQDMITTKRKRIYINIIMVFVTGILLFSYITPDMTYIDKNSILIMSLRGILLMLLWFKIISPIIIKYFKKYFEKNKSENIQLAHKILNNVQTYKSIMYSSWEHSSSQKNMKRIIYFIKILVINFLAYDYNQIEIYSKGL
jgi:hypothetical protein